MIRVQEALSTFSQRYVTIYLTHTFDFFQVVRARERIELELGQKLIPDDELPEEQSSQSTKPPSS